MTSQRTRHDFFYFQIVTRYYLNFIKIEKEFFSQENRIKMNNMKIMLSEYDGIQFTKEELDEINEKLGIKDFLLKFFQLRSFGTISVVFSALCLESLINDYCVFKRSSNYLSNYVDKLDTVSKWKIFPELFTGKPFSNDGKAFELLKGLYSFRNNLVHPKSKVVGPMENLEDEKNPLTQYLVKFNNEVKLSLLTIKEATHELFIIDSSFTYLKVYEWLWTGDVEKLKNLSDIDTFYLSLVKDIRFPEKE